MKITTCQSIDVEVEVDVQLEDVLAELSGQIDESGTRRKLAAIDAATKILERIGVAPLSILTNTTNAGNVAAQLSNRLRLLNQWCVSHAVVPMTDTPPPADADAPAAFVEACKSRISFGGEYLEDRGKFELFIRFNTRKDAMLARDKLESLLREPAGGDLKGGGT